ncbi:hypothetical protein K438DRAFT_1818482 [Mycena galopus ATCC 62051]|nr:hypothetical protein K438DRAFT_1818482 [Mycena galopus ATCC 62051]
MVESISFPPALPKFDVFEQPEGTIDSVGSRRKIDPSEHAYGGLFACARTVLGHFLSTPKARAPILGMAIMLQALNPPAAATFEKRWGDVPPSDEQILDYLAESPPNLILTVPKDLERDLPKKSMCWGIDPHEPINLYHRLLWQISFSHELVHAILKHLFPQIKTLLLPGGIAGDDKDGGGESGHQFETMYFRFKLIAELKKSDAKTEMRMDTITRLLAQTKQKTFELDISTIQQILGSFETKRIYVPEFTNVEPYKASLKHTDPEKYGQYRVGGNSDDDDENPVEKPANGRTRNDGLGLTMAGPKFIGCRLVRDFEAE